MKISSDVAIVVLAAGSASRMGKPKQLLKWGESTLIEHTIHIVIDTNNPNIVVVLGANFEIIEQKITSLPVTIIKNEQWKKGLGSSIAAATKYVIINLPEVKAILFVLADQPFMKTEYLQEIIDCYDLEGNKIMATKYPNGKKGVPALFDKIYFSELSNLNNDSGAKQIIQKYSDHLKILNPNLCNFDIDTIEDYEKMYALRFGKF